MAHIIWVCISFIADILVCAEKRWSNAILRTYSVQVILYNIYFINFYSLAYTVGYVGAINYDWIKLYYSIYKNIVVVHRYAFINKFKNDGETPRSSWAVYRLRF